MSTTTSTTSTTSAQAGSGRHRLEVGHLVMGLAFVGFVAAWALAQAGVVTGTDLRWLLPVPWLVAGAAGLAVIAARSLRPRRQGYAGDEHDEHDLQAEHELDLTTDLPEEERR